MVLLIFPEASLSEMWQLGMVRGIMTRTIVPAVMFVETKSEHNAVQN